MGRLDAVLLTGRQALAIGPYLPDHMNGEHERLVISPDPVYDNCRGWLKLFIYDPPWWGRLSHAHQVPFLIPFHTSELAACLSTPQNLVM